MISGKGELGLLGGAQRSGCIECSVHGDTVQLDVIV